MEHHESERTTRKERIDPRLTVAGWTIVGAGDPPVECAAAVEEYSTANGPADYALAEGGRILGVVEAKKLTVGPDGVLTQAERYSRGIDQTPRYQGEFGVPFLYSTNGKRVMFHDVRNPLNRSREVSGFHTPGALGEMLGRDLDVGLDHLSRIPVTEGVRPC